MPIYMKAVTSVGNRVMLYIYIYMKMMTNSDVYVYENVMNGNAYLH
jgi:hypothetical protein